MRLYHGSNVEIEKVNLARSMPYRDFGWGFYLTVSEEQAWIMAHRRVKRDGGTPIVTIFEVPDDLLERDDLNCRVFPESPSLEWAVFVRNNRDREFRNFNSPCDIVVGPIINDETGLLIRAFGHGIIDAGYLQKALSFGRMPLQVTFHTEKALQYLKKAGVKR